MTPASIASVPRWGLAVLRGTRAAAFTVAILPATACDHSAEKTAEFSCPAPGTVFTLSQPLALSPNPGFHSRVKIAERSGYDCHIFSQANGAYWLHAGLIDSERQMEWRAAAEELWPLKVGNKTHTHFFNRTEFWMVDYEVVALEKFTARVGTVDAYKVLTTVRSGGDVLWRTTLWWSPDLKYTVSYRLVAANAADSRAWEIAAVGTGEL